MQLLTVFVHSYVKWSPAEEMHFEIQRSWEFLENDCFVEGKTVASIPYPFHLTAT